MLTKKVPRGIKAYKRLRSGIHTQETIVHEKREARTSHFLNVLEKGYSQFSFKYQLIRLFR